MPKFLIGINCNIMGCEEQAIVEADNAEQATEFANELAMDTFFPAGWVEEEIESEERLEELLDEGVSEC